MAGTLSELTQKSTGRGLTAPSRLFQQGDGEPDAEAAGGSGGMGMSLTAEQPCVTFSFGGSGGFGGNSGGSALAKGSAFTIGSGSTAVYSGEALCNAGFVFFSSPDLTADSSYDLAAGGSTLATAAAQTGSVQTGMGGMGGQPGQMPGGSFDPGSAPTPPSGDFRPGNKQ